MLSVRPLLLTLILGCGAPATPAAPPAPVAAPASAVGLPTQVERGVVYATVDGRKLLMDIAVPKEGGPYPCVVLFHGGAWRVGSRRDLSTPIRGDGSKTTPSIIEQVAARGYVVATADYRLIPARFPAPVEDAKTAIRFLRANAKKYHIDPKKFAAGGFSAGAHLALMVGLSDKSAELDGTLYPEQDSRVQCVVSFFGPTDLSLYAATPGIAEAYLVPFLGPEAKTDPTVYKRASPITYVSKDDPPVLLVHGDLDVIVPIIHSERMLAKLKEAGVPAKLVTMPFKGHGWFGSPLEKSLQESVRFLDSHLKGKK